MAIWGFCDPLEHSRLKMRVDCNCTRRRKKENESMKTTRLHTHTVLIAGVTLLWACHANTSSPSVTHGPDHGGQPHWSYTGNSGPDHWGSLAPEYSLCATGRSQSPINITNTVEKDLANIDVHYKSMPVELVNNGHTIQVNCAPGSFIIIDGVRYDLIQFHFHSPSEHEIAGHRADAELHLVHKSDVGVLAVVGVMLESGVRDAAFDPVWRHLPDHEGPAVKTTDSINPIDLLPADRRTLRYEGSLTTPPGTEGVKWNLMVEPVTLSQQQLAEFRKVFDGNNRPVQELNGRVVVKDTTP